MTEKSKSFLESTKWIIAVITFVALVICNYFLLVENINSNTYRLDLIEEDRSERWNKYEKDCDNKNILLKAIGEDIAIIKVKLEVIEEGLK